MDCKDGTDKLNAYLDGELPAQAAIEVQEHLHACPRCAEALDELKRLNRALDALEGAAVPVGFARRVRHAAAVPAERGVPSGGLWSVGVRPFGRLLTQAAAVLLAVAGLWFGMTMGGSVDHGAAYVPEVETAELGEFDLHVDSLSAVPTGSVTEVYLAFVGEFE